MVRYRNAGTQVFEDTEHESVDTEGLVVSGQDSDYHWKRIAHFDSVAGSGDTFTVDDVSVGDPYFISLEHLSDESTDADISLNLEFGGMSNGDYDYIESTLERQFNTVTGDDSYPLLDLDLSKSFGKCAGIWIDNQNVQDVSLSGQQGGGRRLNLSNSTYLVSTTSENRPSEVDDMIFNLNTTGTDTSVSFEVYQREGF